MQKDITLVIAAVILILLFIAVLFLLSLFYFNARKRRMLEEKKQMELAFAEELLKTRLEIQEETFRQISQEIHDNIGQSLTLAKLTIATTKPDNAVQVSEALLSSGNILSKAIRDLRNLSHSLNPDFLNTMDLPVVVEQQLMYLQKTGQYNTQFNLTGDHEKIAIQKELILLRVVQELLNNIVKHADATTITIVMAYHPSSLTITISDNGKGFETNKSTNSSSTKGLGLINMQKRVEMIGGTVQFISSPQEGTKVVLKV